MSFRAGLMGYGKGGRVFHAPLLQAAGIELAAVSSSKRAAIERDFPDAAIHDSAESLLADKSLDLIIISTPSATHGSRAIQALEAGHNVVVDKPFAGSVEEADRIIAAADKSGTLLSVFQNRRWDSDFLTIKDLIARDVLGPVHDYRAHFEFFKPDGAQTQEPVDPMKDIQFELGTHLIDQVVQLFGMPDWAMGDLSGLRPGELSVDSMLARFGYGTNRATVTASMYSADDSARYMVHGAKGSYRKSHMDGQEAQLVAGMRAHEDGFGVEDPANYGVVTLREGGTAQEKVWPTRNGEHFTFYRLVREAIQNGTPPPVLASQARDVLRIIEALQTSSQTGSRVML